MHYKDMKKKTEWKGYRVICEVFVKNKKILSL